MEKIEVSICTNNVINSPSDARISAINNTIPTSGVTALANNNTIPTSKETISANDDTTPSNEETISANDNTTLSNELTVLLLRLVFLQIRKLS